MSDATTRRILIASFNTLSGAKDGEALLKSASIGLGNVAIITRDGSGEVKFTESQDWGVGKSALIGAVAGLILPGVGTLTLAAGGALAAYFLDLGFPDTLLKRMGEGLVNNSSMLVALVDATSASQASSVLTQAGAEVASTAETDLARAMGSL